jgi:thymidylate synthase (FAD)
MASLSVKSTRYTLKELKSEERFKEDDFKRASQYLVLTEDRLVDSMSIKALENLRSVLNSKVSNDIAKYCLPESYKSELTWSINARSLQNFLSLRSDKSALWEIRDLANVIYKNLPDEHKYIFKDYIK